MQSDSVAPLLMAKKFGKPSLPAVRVVVEASRVGASRASLKPMSDFLWDYNLHPRLPSIGVPSVIIVGSADDHHPHPAMSEALRNDLSATGLLRAYIVLDGVGHFIPLIQPLETVDGIEQLWSR
ncbi:unnamed protein product [Prorocentrum cordatum]|uniref:Uncharacterized protein n=1 Tax=Prorocentrum cordatum TaxID=2364126 RepID=A0ABN9VPT2_9DINO|nr:unnamed protein product [Polarella glacialis]